MVEEEVIVKIVADASQYDKETKKASESAGRLRNKWREASSQTSSSMGRAGSKVRGFGAKLKGFGTGITGVLSKAAAPLLALDLATKGIRKALQEAYAIARDTSKMYDPARYDKATSKLQRSIRRLKTSMGAVLMPVYEAMSSVMSTLADWLTGLEETVVRVMGYIQGLLGMLGSMEASLSASADAMAEAGAEAEEGLASFDKLNTLGTSELGDMEQAERMNELMLSSAKAGAELRENLKGIFDLSARISGVSDTISTSWTRFKGAVGNTADSIRTSFSSAFSWLRSSVTDVGESIKSALTSAFEVVQRVYDATIGKVIEGIKEAIRKVQELISKLDIVGKLQGIAGGVGDWVTSHIPKFANGGVVAPNNPTLAVIGDNKSEPEVVAPRSMIEDAMRSVMAEGHGGGPTEVTINIDGRKVAHATYDYIEQEYKRRGASW